MGIVRTAFCVLVTCLIIRETLAKDTDAGRNRASNRRQDSEAGADQDGDLFHLDRNPPAQDFTCKQRNKCSKRSGTSMGFYDQNCFCDDLCKMYGDCCKDYKGSLSESIPAHFRLSKRTLNCHRVIPIDQMAEIYRVDKCPSDYEDAFVREKCEDTHSLDQFLEIPVSGQQTGILYKNYYCAICAGDVNLSFWSVKWLCENGPSIDNVTNTEQLLDDVWIMGAGNCIYEFTHPTMQYRRCKSHLSRCPKYWDGDPNVAKKCKETTSYTYADNSMDFMVFGNEYCAQCYGINNTYLTCRDPRGFGVEHRPSSSSHTSSFSILLDIPTGTGVVRTRNSDDPDMPDNERTVTFRRCEEDHVYDPFNKICRRVTCPGEMYFVQGDCITEQQRRQRTTTRQSITVVVTSTRKSRPTTRRTTAHNRFTQRPEIHEILTTSQNIPREKHNDDVILPKPDYEAAPPDAINTVGVGLDCPLKTFNLSQYATLQNSSVFVFSLQQVFDTGSYILEDSTLYVCEPASDGTHMDPLVDENKSLMFQYDRIQSLVSFIGILISLISLFICFLAHMILPPIRTVPGKCIVGLSVSLFVAQGLYLAGSLGIQHKLSCKIVGIAMHYALVAAFCWTNCLAVDICKAFGNSNRSNHDKKNSSYTQHSLYAWLFPAFLVGICVTLDMVDFSALGIEQEIDIYRPYYGDNLCWITRRKALIYLLGAPFGVILLIDIFTYMAAIKNMYTVPVITKAASRRDKDKNRFLLYIKLSFIMAMTWTFGLLATFTKFEELWYPFIVFNSLQGAFICFAFVCTRKVFRLLRTIGRVHKSSNTNNTRPYHRAYSNATTSNPWGYSRSNFLYEDMETNNKIIAQETSI